MKDIIKLLSIIAVCSIIALGSLSCNKSTLNNPQTAGYTEVCDEQSAMENFSISLSKVVFSHPEVRDFLKNEALKRFDNDDEVFYPFIKDKQVGDLGSFRQLLINELGSEGKIEKIEKQLLTLTILVSDATWIDKDGFCLDNWDTTDPYVAITYQEKDGTCKKLFGDGCLLGTIEKGTIPGGPVLIVKESERLAASIPTKGGEVEYSFLYDAFDASKNETDTKSNYSAEWLNEPSPATGKSISGMVLKQINPDILEAHELFLNDSYACQNDFIFYGMRDSESIGRIRRDVRSKIYRFKLDAGAFEDLFDDKDGNKPDWGPGLIKKSYETYGYEDSKETVYAKLWSDGALEIRFTILTGGNEDLTVYSVKGRDLFNVKDDIVLKERWGATLIKWHITWRYSFNESRNYKRDESSLISKWYYPRDNFTLPVWDLTGLSEYQIEIKELDSGASHTDERDISIKCADSSTNKMKDGDKVEMGWSPTDEVTVTTKQIVTWKEENDDLGTITIRYEDKYIDHLGASGYVLYDYGGKRFQFTILPYRY